MNVINFKIDQEIFGASWEMAKERNHIVVIHSVHFPVSIAELFFLVRWFKWDTQELSAHLPSLPPYHSVLCARANNLRREKWEQPEDEEEK